MSREKVVVVGAGFGGLAAAKVFAKAGVDLTVVDRENHFTFQPLLYQVATAGLSPAQITTPIRHAVRGRNVRVVMAGVSDVDHEAREVQLEDGRRIPYDKLILATGATHAYFGNDWEDVAPGLKTVADATSIRAKILTAFERAESCGDVAERKAWMTFVVVGAGPTGVEIAGAISELAHRALIDEFKHIDPVDAKIILLDAADRVLGGLDEELAHKAEAFLGEIDVDVRLGKMVEHIDSSGVVAAGEKISAKTVIWAAGVQASPVAKWLDVESDRAGRVDVDPYLRVPDREGVFLLGDAARLDDLPGLATVAMQQGKYVALQVLGKTTEPFRYFDKGSMATVGRNFAVAQIGRIRLAGRLAWILWLFVHLMYVANFRKRLTVLIDWAWSYVAWRRGARIIVRQDGPGRGGPSRGSCS